MQSKWCKVIINNSPPLRAKSIKERKSRINVMVPSQKTIKAEERFLCGLTFCGTLAILLAEVLEHDASAVGIAGFPRMVARLVVVHMAGRVVFEGEKEGLLRFNCALHIRQLESCTISLHEMQPQGENKVNRLLLWDSHQHIDLCLEEKHQIKQNSLEIKVHSF